MKQLIKWLVLGQVMGDPRLIWPEPKESAMGNSSVGVSDTFKFLATGMESDILARGIERYLGRVSETLWAPVVPIFRGVYPTGDKDSLSSLEIQVKEPSKDLGFDTDESYELAVNADSYGRPYATLSAKSVFGALHGLESFVQMLQYDATEKKRYLSGIPFRIKDEPKFPHRGLMLDTSRNYYNVSDILRTIRAMSMNKMNVFHWHIVDSQSWPFKSLSHPLLSKKGAIFPNQIYTYKDIQLVVKYGRDHGVRVVPELEAPAHAYSITLAYPELATCTAKENPRLQAIDNVQVNPTNPLATKVVTQVIDEFAFLFPDHYVHLSGDEINTGCWNNTPSIRQYMLDKSVTPRDLLVNFTSSMYNQAKMYKKDIIVWQEALLGGKIDLPKDAVVQVWLNATDLKKVVDLKHRAIASSYQHWYLDCGFGPYRGDSPSGSSWCKYNDWQTIYRYHLTANLNPSQHSLVLGGEVAIWSEQVDPVNLDLIAWPRSSLAAQVLWKGNTDSANQILPTKDILPRLNNFRHYLVRNKIRAEAIQPMWCIVNPGRCNTTPRGTP